MNCEHNNKCVSDARAEADNQVQIYTAAQIAVCLGNTPRAVRKALREVDPAGVRLIFGNETAAWTFDQLPQALRTRLNDEARRLNYRDAKAMLDLPPKLWEPSMPIDKIRDEDIAAANKLRQALKPWLIQMHNLTLSSADLEAQGVADYVRAFGHRITGRYWRELFTRTLKRDGGAENWDRLEIYLPDKVRAKDEPAQMVSEALNEQFAKIESYIQACENPLAPSAIQQRAIWTLAFDHYAAMVRTGSTPKQAARRVRQYLAARAPFLAASRDALLKAFDRKLKVFEASFGDAKTLRDGRAENGSPYRLMEADRDLLIHRAVFHYRGDVAPAWRELLRSGFSEPVRARYAGKAGSKSHVPHSVMDSVGPEVEILTVMHQGPRAYDQIRGHVDRTYDFSSRKGFVWDDFTMPVYYYVPDGEGWFILTRGQILIAVDIRTLRVVGWSMQPDRNYSSLTIRSLCTHVFSEHGVPDVMQFERGIWESSKLLKGRDPAPFEFGEVVQGLREFGMKFIHSIRARSKTVERVGGLLQDLMEAEPGYCGRDERRDAPETLRKQMAEVEARKVHPSKYFYSCDLWFQRFGEIVARYNAEPQDGKILEGLSPDVAFAKFADPNDPPKEFGAGLRYLLAHHKEVKLVTLNGITFEVGKQRFNYRGNEIAHLVGQEVLAWFDSENPETLTVTDMNRRNPICVGRSQKVSALEIATAPGSGTLAAELARVEQQGSYMKARFQAVKSKFPMPQRQALADRRTLELGEQIEGLKAGRRAKAVSTEAMRDRAGRQGIPAIMVSGDDDARRALDLFAEAERDHARDMRPSESTALNAEDNL